MINNFCYLSLKTVNSSIFNYVPIVSTVKNLIDLFLKIVILPMKDSNAIGKSHYYSCLTKESRGSLIILAIPLIGTNFCHKKR